MKTKDPLHSKEEQEGPKSLSLRSKPDSTTHTNHTEGLPSGGGSFADACLVGLYVWTCRDALGSPDLS